jgi:hypothetical protein
MNNWDGHGDEVAAPSNQNGAAAIGRTRQLRDRDRTMTSTAAAPDSAVLARHIDALLRDGIPHVRIEHALVAAFGHIPRPVMSAAFGIVATLAWREQQHPAIAAERDADQT